jgi:hypothetical protein
MFVKYLDMPKEKKWIRQMENGKCLQILQRNIFGDYNSFEKFVATKLRVWSIGWSYTYYYWFPSLKVN